MPATRMKYQLTKGLRTDVDETQLEDGQLKVAVNSRMYSDGRVTRVKGATLITTKSSRARGYYQYQTKYGRKFHVYCLEDKVILSGEGGTFSYTPQSNRDRVVADPTLVFCARYNTSFEPTYDLVAVSTSAPGNVRINPTGGEFSGYLSHTGGSAYESVIYTGTGMIPVGEKGMISFWYIPDFTGTPPAKKRFWGIGSAIGSNVNRMTMHDNIDLIAIDIYDSSGSLDGTDGFGVYSGYEEGVPVHIEYDFDFSAGGEQRLFFNGVQQGDTKTRTCTRTVSVNAMVVAAQWSPGQYPTAMGGFDEVQIYNEVKHAADFTPPTTEKMLYQQGNIYDFVSHFDRLYLANGTDDPTVLSDEEAVVYLCGYDEGSAIAPAFQVLRDGKVASVTQRSGVGEAYADAKGLLSGRNNFLWYTGGGAQSSTIRIAYRVGDQIVDLLSFSTPGGSALDCMEVGRAFLVMGSSAVDKLYVCSPKGDFLGSYSSTGPITFSDFGFLVYGGIQQTTDQDTFIVYSGNEIGQFGVDWASPTGLSDIAMSNDGAVFDATHKLRAATVWFDEDSTESYVAGELFTAYDNNGTWYIQSRSRTNLGVLSQTSVVPTDIRCMTADENYVYFVGKENGWYLYRISKTLTGATPERVSSESLYKYPLGLYRRRKTLDIQMRAADSAPPPCALEGYVHQSYNRTVRYAVKCELTGGILSGATFSNTIAGSENHTLLFVPPGPTWTNPATGATEGTIKRHIYREVSGIFYYDKTINDNDPAVLTMTATDATVSAGESMPTVGENIQGNYLATHQDRVFLAGDPRFPNTIHYAETGEPFAWPTYNNFVTDDDTADPINQIESIGVGLYVWTKDRYWQVLGDLFPLSPNVRVEVVSEKAGCASPFSMQKLDKNTVICLTELGWYIFEPQGDPREISRFLDTRGELEWDKAILKNNCACIVREKHEYWCAVTLSGESSPSRIYRWNWELGGWFHGDLPPTGYAGCFGYMEDDEDLLRVVMGYGNCGDFYNLEDGTTFAGSEIQTSFEAIFTWQEPSLTKTIREIVIEYDGQLSIERYLNADTTKQGSTIVLDSKATRGYRRIPAKDTCLYYRLKFLAAQDFTLYGLAITMEPKRIR